jgi:methyltransferase (TIGR00027 family)
MPKTISLLVFIIIEVVLLPVTIMGLVLFSVTFMLEWRTARTSMTAYDPLFTRWILDAQGKRKDEACRQLLYDLPGGSPFVIKLIMGPTLLAMRISGLTISMYDYPVYNSTSIGGVLGHRTRFIDDALLSYLDSMTQVVILGAGWDTRVYNLDKQADVRAFEVDTAKTQTQKRKSLALADIDASGVIFATADFNKESWLDALKKVGFDPDKSTFVLWEGVTYYLEAQAVEATLQTVAAQLAPGSVIAFDYPAKHIIEGDASLIYRLLVRTTQLIGEPWVFGISTEAPAEQQLAAFLEQNGLHLAAYEAIGDLTNGEKAQGGLAMAING